MKTTNCKKVALRHYFRDTPIECKLLSGKLENFFTIQMKESVCLEKHIMKGDPITFGILDENSAIVMNGGSIISYTEKDCNLVISPDRFSLYGDRRECKRFPVSLYAHIRKLNSKKSMEVAYLKDISYVGFRIYSEIELDQGDVVELDIHIPYNVIHVRGTIVRRSTCYNRNEYGIQIIYHTKKSLLLLKEYIDGMMSNDEEVFRKYLTRMNNK